MSSAGPDAAFALTDRVAIVTGGGTGIGAATARLLAEHGADVVIAARTLADLEAVAGHIEGDTGRRILPVVTDVKQQDDVARMVERTMDEFGRIDILVNNAGGTRLGPLESLPLKGWDATFDLNLRWAFDRAPTETPSTKTFWILNPALAVMLYVWPVPQFTLVAPFGVIVPLAPALAVIV